jgi:hypothetical protein
MRRNEDAAIANPPWAEERYSPKSNAQPRSSWSILATSFTDDAQHWPHREVLLGGTGSTRGIDVQQSVHHACLRVILRWAQSGCFCIAAKSSSAISFAIGCRGTGNGLGSAHCVIIRDDAVVDASDAVTSAVTTGVLFAVSSVQ